MTLPLELVSRFEQHLAEAVESLLTHSPARVVDDVQRGDDGRPREGEQRVSRDGFAGERAESDDAESEKPEERQGRDQDLDSGLHHFDGVSSAPRPPPSPTNRSTRRLSSS